MPEIVTGVVNVQVYNPCFLVPDIVVPAEYKVDNVTVFDARTSPGMPLLFAQTLNVILPSSPSAAYIKSMLVML